MKKTLYTIFAALSVVATMTSCEDFLTKEPETDLSPGSFFSNDTELELWSNRYYNQFPAPEDLLRYYADDCVGSALTDVAKGTRTPEDENWGTGAWQYLRWINLQFEYDQNCADDAVREKYEGVAHFFRAWFYFEKVKKYGGVPYYDYVISDTDWTSLKKPRDSRGYVMYKVIKDLDDAYNKLPDEWPSDATYRLSKNAALALKSRAALFEGTFRKYHGIEDETVDGETISAQWFLEQAAEAANLIISQNKYSVYKKNSTGLGAYRDFFILEDAAPEEVILGIRYNTDLLIRHTLQFALLGNYRVSATNRFANHYLMADGSKVQDKPGYEKMTYAESFKDRDPRMAQTLLAPGYKQVGQEDETVETMKNNLGSYSVIKFISDDSHNTAATSTTDWPLFRYPEVLLNYAEAKAELGTLTQDDIEITVNAIRDRVGMKHMSLEDAKAAPDALMASYYPNVTQSDMTGAILEIRRERTVELVAEGFRQWDMLRWKEGKFLTPNAYADHGFEGLYFPSLGEFDMNGDGQADILLYTGEKPSTRLEAYSVDEGGLKLSEGDHGYVLMYNAETYQWNEERDYLWPIPQDQRIATGGALTQNPGY